MEFAQGRPPDLTQAADREAQLIERYRGRIAGFDRFAGMDFVGLAWGDVPWSGGGFGRVVFVVDVGEPPCDCQ